MSLHLFDAMVREGFEEVRAIHHSGSGLRAFLAVHDSTHGPAFGGIRRWRYRSEGEALLDCMRLAVAMTHKCALAGLPAGGAKLVALVDAGTDWDAAYRHIGRVVEEMNGRFYTGPDVGTGERELGWVAASTSYVTRPGPEGPGELSAATAEGVFRSIAACLRQLDGEEDWQARCVVVQGLGAVGARLAARLRSVGVRVIGAEIDAQRAEAVGAELGIELVDPSTELDQDCDVFAPCALGGILHDLSIERLRARVVAGGANNVLAGELNADQLHRRGILYAPDIIVNSGALIRGSIFHLEGRRESVAAVGERVGATLAAVLDGAAAEDAAPARIALREAEARVAAWREAR